MPPQKIFILMGLRVLIMQESKYISYYYCYLCHHSKYFYRVTISLFMWSFYDAVNEAIKNYFLLYL